MNRSTLRMRRNVGRRVQKWFAQCRNQEEPAAASHQTIYSPHRVIKEHSSPSSVLRSRECKRPVDDGPRTTGY